jgi:predicted SprT family Zn-dependent metalloprotease
MNLLLSVLLALSFTAPQNINIRLTHYFESVNDSYFDGTLPKDVIVYSDDAEGNMGLTDRCNGNSFCIHINPKLNTAKPSEALTVMHEACHVWVESTIGPQFDVHGAVWQGCMHRLANQNAFEGIW